MQLENVIQEKMFALVAPDGSWQGMTLAHDYPTCMAIIKMLHKAGLGQSYHKLMIDGFKILPVTVTMTLTHD